jgi:cobalt-zinc-cadmium efflux system outer membrane protein
MSIRVRAYAWIAVFGLTLPCAAAAQDRTDREVVDLIVRAGPQAKAIRAGADVAHQDQRARLAYPNPAVTYSREGAGFTEFLQVEQPLPIFGVRGALSEAGVAATEAAEAERDARLWALRADAAGAAARLLAGQARLAAADAYAEDVARLLDVLATREREGEGSRFDRLRAEQELRDARQLATAVTLAVAEVRTALAAMLPRDVTLARVTGSLYLPQAPPPAADLFARAVGTRAELRALESSGRRATLESDVARRSRFAGPTLVGGLKRSEGDSGRQSGGVFGVTLPLPLFDTGGREAARWEAERVRLDAERASIEHQIRMEIVRTSDALALQQAAVAQDQEAAGDELTRIALVAYRDGEVGILELLDAIRTSSRARGRSIDIRLNARLAQIALERAVGDLIWP